MFCTLSLMHKSVENYSFCVYGCFWKVLRKKASSIQFAAVTIRKATFAKKKNSILIIWCRIKINAETCFFWSISKVSTIVNFSAKVHISKTNFFWVQVSFFPHILWYHISFELIINVIWLCFCFVWTNGKLRTLKKKKRWNMSGCFRKYCEKNQNYKYCVLHSLLMHTHAPREREIEYGIGAFAILSSL